MDPLKSEAKNVWKMGFKMELIKQNQETNTPTQCTASDTSPSQTRINLKHLKMGLYQ